MRRGVGLWLAGLLLVFVGLMPTGPLLAKSLHGRVADGEGRPVPHALVALIDETGRDSTTMTLPFRTTRTRQDGGFSFTVSGNLGASALSVSSPRGWVYQRLGAVAAGARVDLRLQACAPPTSLVLKPRPGAPQLQREVLVPLRQFTIPPQQFVLPLSIRPHASCLPQAEFVAQREARWYAVGPSLLDAATGAPIAQVALWPVGAGPALPSAVQAAVLPLTGEDSLRRLAQSWRAYRVVALGENSHGAANGWRLLAAMFEHAALADEFGILALEGDAYRIGRIDAALQANDLARAERELHEMPDWVLQTEETRELLRVLHRQNQGRPPEARVRVIGLDVVLHYFAYRDLARLIEVNWPALRQSYAARLASFELSGMELEQRLDADEAARLSSALDSLARELANTVQGRERETAELHIDYLRTYLRWRVAESPLALRDLDMGRSLLRGMERHPGRRALLVAHNGHVIHERQGGAPALGRVLQEALGRDYLAIGTVLGRGSVRALHPTKGVSVQVIEDRTGQRGKALEQAFAQRAALDQYLALDAVASASKPPSWLTSGVMMQNIGAYYEPESGSTQLWRISLGDSYGALLYYHEARASTALQRGGGER